MSCHEVQEALLDGALSQQVTEHLARCSTCNAHARLLQALDSLRLPLPEPGGANLDRLPHPRWLFRLPFTYTPLLAGLSFLAGGALLLGGRGGWPGHQQLRLLGQALLESVGYGIGDAVGKAAVVFGQGLGWTGVVIAVGLLLASLRLLSWAVGRRA